MRACAARLEWTDAVGGGLLLGPRADISQYLSRCCCSGLCAVTQFWQLCSYSASRLSFIRFILVWVQAPSRCGPNKSP